MCGRSPATTTNGELGSLVEFGDIGLRRGALDDDDDKPRRVKSMLKLERRESGGNGDELLRVRV